MMAQGPPNTAITRRTLRTPDPEEPLKPKAPTLDYSYSVDIDIDDGVLDKLRGPIADEMREQGWIVDYDEDLDMVSFRHEDGRTMGVAVSEKRSIANVGGNTPFRNPDS